MSGPRYSRKPNIDQLPLKKWCQMLEAEKTWKVNKETRSPFELILITWTSTTKCSNILNSNGIIPRSKATCRHEIIPGYKTIHPIFVGITSRGKKKCSPWFIDPIVITWEVGYEVYDTWLWVDFHPWCGNTTVRNQFQKKISSGPLQKALTLPSSAHVSPSKWYIRERHAWDTTWPFSVRSSLM